MVGKGASWSVVTHIVRCSYTSCCNFLLLCTKNKSNPWQFNCVSFFVTKLKLKLNLNLKPLTTFPYKVNYVFENYIMHENLNGFRRFWRSRKNRVGNNFLAEKTSPSFSFSVLVRKWGGLAAVIFRLSILNFHQKWNLHFQTKVGRNTLFRNY